MVGSGPNGLAAAITLAREGLSVIVIEAETTIGGGCRSAELTLPGFVHDVCSAIHPLAAASPFFQTLPLERYGVEWVHPSAPLAHPLDDGSAAILERSLETTGDTLGDDARSWLKLFGPLVRSDQLIPQLLSPMTAGRILPPPPIGAIPALTYFALNGIRSAEGLARARFEGERARALFAGMAAHALLPLEQRLTAGFGLTLGLLAHSVGWPIPKGGSQAIVSALSAHLKELGGEIVVGQPVGAMSDLPPARATLFDLTPRQINAIAGDRLPSRFMRTFRRFRYGPGVFKVDWALDGPIPWKAEECLRAATAHLGGTLDEMASSEDAIGRGQHPDRPYVLVAQQSLFDPTRAPEGKQTVWAYCHVPGGSTVDMTAAIENQIERFAPGFRDRILGRASMGTQDMERHNGNYIGGDINGGVQDLSQMFRRPSARWVPYSTPVKDIFICSSSTPPGGGVHGMSGYHAARAALRRAF